MKFLLERFKRIVWRRSVLSVVILITLITIFYIEEDWRGARTWAATKAKWETKGESLDLKTFVPASIPDDQNLASIPLFKVEQVEWSPGKFDSENVTLRRAIRSDKSPGQELPSLARWQQGELPDLGKIRTTPVADYAEAFKSAPPTDSLDQLDALYPFLSDLLSVYSLSNLVTSFLIHGLSQLKTAVFWSSFPFVLLLLYAASCANKFQHAPPHFR